MKSLFSKNNLGFLLLVLVAACGGAGTGSVVTDAGDLPEVPSESASLIATNEVLDLLDSINGDASSNESAALIARQSPRPLGLTFSTDNCSYLEEDQTTTVSFSAPATVVASDVFYFQCNATDECLNGSVSASVGGFMHFDDAASPTRANDNLYAVNSMTGLAAIRNDENLVLYDEEEKCEKENPCVVGATYFRDIYSEINNDVESDTPCVKTITINTTLAIADTEAGYDAGVVTEVVIDLAFAIDETASGLVCDEVEVDCDDHMTADSTITVGDAVLTKTDLCALIASGSEGECSALVP